MNYTISLSGSPYTLSTSDDAQIAAIAACRAAYNAGKDEANQLATDAEYLSFVFGHWAQSFGTFTADDLNAAAANAFASYANQNPPKQIVESVPLTGDALKAALKAYAAQKRYAVETGGMTFMGMAIPTDRETQSKLSGAVLAFQTGAISGAINWKTSAGWAQLDQAAVTALASAVAAHVQTAFTNEKSVSDAIDAETITTIEQINAANWS
jgi:hypothetical protein